MSAVRSGHHHPVNASLRFLVVDDFATMRRIIRGLLREIGYTHVDEAEDGIEALGKVRGHRYDFIVCDVNMPNLGGFGLLARLKADDDFKDVPVLLVTAESRSEDRVRAMREGAAGYIVKPFTRASLQSSVADILQRAGKLASV